VSPTGGKQHGLVIAQGIQQLVIALDERLLLLLIELAGIDLRFVIFPPQS
jgi:hypothetical protein